MINPNNKGRATRGHYWKPLLKKECEYAIGQTTNMSEAARYLHVDYNTFKKWAKMYGVFKPNQHQRGKKKNRIADATPFEEIFAGLHPHYNRTRLKNRLIRSGTKPNECELCGYNKVNPITNSVPLTLYNLDGNNFNLSLDNLQLRCYNCVYITSDKPPRNKSESNELRQMSTDMKELGNITDEEFRTLQEELLDEVNKNNEEII